MRVSVNPERLAADKRFQVLHPDSRRPFPSEPFDMSDTDWQNPRVRRLFAPAGQTSGVAGGVFGDLVVVDTPAAAPAAAASVSSKTKD